jgi:HEAT repeat protein
MALFGQAGTPNIERLKAKRDARGLIKALSYEADDAESASSIHRAAAHALGELRDPQAVEPLIETLEASGRQWGYGALWTSRNTQH